LAFQHSCLFDSCSGPSPPTNPRTLRLSNRHSSWNANFWSIKPYFTSMQYITIPYDANFNLKQLMYVYIIILNNTLCMRENSLFETYKVFVHSHLSTLGAKVSSRPTMPLSAAVCLDGRAASRRRRWKTAPG
jgi:hypothetical protein